MKYRSGLRLALLSGISAMRDDIAISCLKVDRRRLVVALAGALDFVGIDEFQHAKRVALMARRCAIALGWDEATRDLLLDAALLHDCGVSSDREHTALINELEWAATNAHCQRGARYLTAVPVLAHLVPLVLHHHSHWDRLKDSGLGAAAWQANLIFLADRVDMLRAAGHDGGQIREVIRRYAGSFFEPRLVAAFERVSLGEDFWSGLTPTAVEAELDSLVAQGCGLTVDFPTLRAIALMFARIIDAKSHFTEEHSVGVARLARWLGQCFGLPLRRCDELEVAGLLHDLGKLKVPDSILEKPAPLSEAEWAIMRRHSFDSWQILRQAFGDGHIADWAGCHHETLCGSGYPFHRRGPELSFEARIVAVADVVQALAQDRPYRNGLDARQIGLALERMVDEGKLDPAIIAAVRPHLDDCRQIALQEPHPGARQRPVVATTGR